MKTKPADRPEWGSFALVTYIPEPLGSFLNSLRRALPGDEKPQAHITVLPPRPLQADIDLVSRQAQSILIGCKPFSVELADVKVFPETNVLYLDVSGGSEALHRLHDALNSGLLEHDENFDFLPHLTISGSIPSHNLSRFREQASHAWQMHQGKASFDVNEVVALWQPQYTSPDDWNRMWSQKLGDSGSSARAGSRR